MTTASPSAGADPNAGPASGGLLLAKNAGALFVGQGVGLVVPLLTVPYLARVLGPSGWGPVLAAQALGNWLLLVLEFGFELSGTRAVAHARTVPHTMSDVVHGVQSAKAGLVSFAVPIIVIGLIAIPAVRQYPGLLAWTVTFAVLRGFSPLWFFQGIERVQGAVAVDAVTRAAAALGVFVFVHGPGDGWRVIALQAVFAAVALVVLTGWLARHVALRLPTRAAAIATLRASSSIFACRAWSGLYIQGNALILSALAGPAVVAFFGGAERIIRAAINLLQPLTQVFLPRVTYLRVVQPAAARRMIRSALLGVGALGVAMGLCGLIGAPILVRVLLGPEYRAAIPVLRLMGALPMLVAVNTVLGLYWALPFGHERLLLGSIIAAGVVNVALALLLVPRWGATGMAASTIVAEVVALIVLTAVYLRSGQ
ncbi:MAG TPA: oligosaccharide flippase family protein [Gemmatimonadaceae bacterium]